MKNVSEGSGGTGIHERTQPPAPGPGVESRQPAERAAEPPHQPAREREGVALLVSQQGDGSVTPASPISTNDSGAPRQPYKLRRVYDEMRRDDEEKRAKRGPLTNHAM